MDARTHPCACCGERDQLIEQLLATTKDLEAEVAKLKAQLAARKKNSSNSSKPPSSDIVKPPKPTNADGSKRKIGGQPGHDQHVREPFPETEIDLRFPFELDGCPSCGGVLDPSHEPPRRLQQVELHIVPVVCEYQGMPSWCPRCQKTHYAPLPRETQRAGLIGPRLSAIIAYLKGDCHCSYSTIRRFLRDVCNVKVSRGQLAKVVAKVSESLEPLYAGLDELIRTQAYLNIDETGHKDRGKAMWTWCFRAELFTLFKISPSRGSDVLLDVLGLEFNGLLGCDYFSAYRKYMRLNDKVLVQFCLAHLIRDIKFLTTHPDARNRHYGARLLTAAKELFAIIHRREVLPAADFAAQLEDAGNNLGGAALLSVPRTAEAQNLARRFQAHGDSYLRFLTHPEIEPTNNLAEQAIRFVVLDRLVTQGTRGETGQRWSERIWTTIATCVQQGRSVFEVLSQAVEAFFCGTDPPTLVPNGT